MSLLLGVLIAVHLLVCIALIAVILLQRSEGGALGMGGGGGSGFMTARGAGNLLTRTTSILAGLFFALSLALTLLAGGRTSSSVTDRIDIESLDPSRLGPAAPGVTPGSTAPATTGLPTAPGSVTAPSPGIGGEDAATVAAPPTVLEAPRPSIRSPTSPAAVPDSSAAVPVAPAPAAPLPDATTTPPN